MRHSGAPKPTRERHTTWHFSDLSSCLPERIDLSTHKASLGLARPAGSVRFLVHLYLALSSTGGRSHLDCEYHIDFVFSFFFFSLGNGSKARQQPPPDMRDRGHVKYQAAVFADAIAHQRRLPVQMDVTRPYSLLCIIPQNTVAVQGD